MKTLKQKISVNTRLAIGGVLAMVLIFLIAAVPYEKVNQAAKKEATNITRLEKTRQLQKDKLKESKAERDKIAVIEAKKDLRKTKADLKRERAYLKADKKALVRLHENDMKETCSAMKESKRDMRSAKRQLRKDLWQGDYATLVEHAQLVVKKHKAFETNEAKFDRQQKALDADLAAIDSRLKITEGKENKSQTELAWGATANTEKGYYEPSTTTGEIERNTNAGGTTVLEK
ncbi:MAG TPA: hypothetical protein VNJ07_09380 [Chitinophagales bacterium]|nr:hypothetical protein [Chitinophagales bacterium]